MRINRKTKFKLGRVVSTRAALHEVQAHEVAVALSRHGAGDWGDVNEHEAKANEQALGSGGGRLFSVYSTRGGVKFWIITEADRSSTKVLLPDEY